MTGTERDVAHLQQARKTQNQTVLSNTDNGRAWRNQWHLELSPGVVITDLSVLRQGGIDQHTDWQG